MSKKQHSLPEMLARFMYVVTEGLRELSNPAIYDPIRRQRFVDELDKLRGEYHSLIGGFQIQIEPRAEAPKPNL